MSQLSFEYHQTLDHPLWQFSQQLYMLAPVQQACLSLQNQLQMNLNVVFFCCWYAASRRGQLQKADFRRIQTALHHWHTAISLPLRQLRRTATKGTAQPMVQRLKQRITQCELTAAKMEQTLLLDTFPHTSISNRSQLQQVQDARNNLVCYTKYIHNKWPTDAKGSLQLLVSHVFSSLSPGVIAQIFDRRP